MQNFRNLAVWKKAHDLVLATYAATNGFPREELYGLRLQLRTSATSIGMNIAEGCGRSGDKDFARFLHFSMGSANELEYQILLARDLRFISIRVHSELECRTTEIKKMLASLLRKLRAESCELKARS